MEARKKWDLVSIATIPLTMTLANSMLIPVLPDMQKEMGITAFQASLIITVYAAVAILFIPIAGYLSDRYGRKAVILPGLLIVAVSGVACGWAAAFVDRPYPIILGARLVQGLGAAGSFPVVLPLVGDLFRRPEDVSNGLGIVETSNTFGKVLSPILGSLLALWAWHIPFWSIPVLSMLSFFMVAFLVKKPKEKKQEPIGPRAFLRSIGALFKKHGRWMSVILTAGGIAMFILFGALFFLSETLEGRKIHGVAKGALLAIPLAALCTAAFFTGKGIGSNKARMKWIGTTALALACGSLAAAAIVRSDAPWWLIVILAASCAGLGAALPCLDALLTESIDKEQRGTITSIYSSMRFIGVAAGPPASALLIEGSASVLFWVMTGACGAACVLVLFFIKPSGSAKAPAK